MKIFCLPYAGGSQFVYSKWKKLLEPSIKLEAVELRGHGTRYSEGFYEDVKEAVDDIYLMIREKINEEEYAIYGHSMGSILAYEAYYKILESGDRKPKHIFFSGATAPNYRRKREDISKLPDEEFMNKVIEIGGTPVEVKESKELCEFVLPILRNDFRILEDYRHKSKKGLIESDISILNGDKDNLELEGIIEWQKHCNKNPNIYTLEGNHFFIENNLNKVIDIIKKTLLL
jgi:surfactin synthase thioesterase subunit